MTFVVDRVRQRMVTHADGLVTYADLNEHLDAEERERGLGLPELIDASGAFTDLKADDVARRAAGGADITGRAVGTDGHRRSRCDGLRHGEDVFDPDGACRCAGRGIPRPRRGDQLAWKHRL